LIDTVVLRSASLTHQKEGGTVSNVVIKLVQAADRDKTLHVSYPYSQKKRQEGTAYFIEEMPSPRHIWNTIFLLIMGWTSDIAHSYVGIENRCSVNVSRERKHVKINASIVSLHGRKIHSHRLMLKDEEGEPRVPRHRSRDSSLQASSLASARVTTPENEEVILSPLEVWCLSHLDLWYHRSQALKCPFFRRRYGDALDILEKIIKYTIVRRQCWPLMGPPQALRPAGSNKRQHRIKYKNIAIEDLRTYVRSDWKPDTGKGYYVTGKLTTACYRDDCLFTGPDPDMPIKGLRKYVGVAAHLFDIDTSRATLYSLEVLDHSLAAKWEFRGVLHLPWRPSLPTLSGRTIYHVDEEGLIYHHEEFWDLSVVCAFCCTFFPVLAKHIWQNTNTD